MNRTKAEKKQNQVKGWGWETHGTEAVVLGLQEMGRFLTVLINIL